MDQRRRHVEKEQAGRRRSGDYWEGLSSHWSEIVCVCVCRAGGRGGLGLCHVVPLASFPHKHSLICCRHTRTHTHTCAVSHTHSQLSMRLSLPDKCRSSCRAHRNLGRICWRCAQTGGATRLAWLSRLDVPVLLPAPRRSLAPLWDPVLESNRTQGPSERNRDMCVASDVCCSSGLPLIH